MAKKIKKSTFGKKQETREVEYVDGFFITLARANNRNFRDKMKKFRKSLKKSQPKYKKVSDEFENLTAEQEDKMLSDAYADTVLVGWRGLLVDGEAVDYSEEVAAELLFVEEDFREFVAEQAADFEQFELEVKEETLKNSPTPTTGD